MSLVENVGRRRTRCPRCDGELAAVKSGHALMAGCGKCRGVWVDRPAFDRIYKKSLLDTAGGRFGMAREWRGKRSKGSTVGEGVKCPVCYHWMEARNFENFPDLVVDVCYRHGTWLDGNELQAILRFVKGRPEPDIAANSGGAMGRPAGSGSVAGAASTAAAAIVTAPVIANGSGPQERSALEGAGEWAMEALDLVADIGVDLPNIGDVGDLVAAVGEIAAGLFSGL